MNFKQGENLDLPENFPADLPLADDANIVQTNSSSTTNFVGYMTEMSPSDINDLYLPYLESGKFKEEPSIFENKEDGETYKVMQSNSETENVSIQFTDSDDIENGTNVIIVVATPNEDDKQ